jgi:methionyl-tRNA synthetase
MTSSTAPHAAFPRTDLGHRPFYITTPIYYVNDVPHLGHAYTTVAADVLTRFTRAQGREAYFLTGVDEHGQKVQQAAEKRGLSPQAHCDELHTRFKALWDKLDIRADDFMRTTDPHHKKAVQAVLQLFYDQGLIEKRTYEGWYSTASERFFTEKELVDGKDPDTGLPVEWISETNYFFVMSRYADQIRRLVEKGEVQFEGNVYPYPGFVGPKGRDREVLGFLDKGLEDLCISRPKARLSWGISLPFDPDYVTYVWFDALLNYASGVGYWPVPGATNPVEHPRNALAAKHYWPAAFHLVGKDILTTHAVYWTAMQFALLELAERRVANPLLPAQHLFAHGWWTVEGRKMSKSLRNVVDPMRLVEVYGADPVRYFVLREMPFGNDGDFSHAAIIGRINADLGNDLGNGLNRAVSMTERYMGGVVPTPTAGSDAFAESVNVLAREITAGESLAPSGSGEVGEFFRQYLEKVAAIGRLLNEYIDRQAPWALHKAGDTAGLSQVLYNALEACRVAAVLLAPVMPRKAAEMLAALGIDLDADPVTGQPKAFAFAGVQHWGGLVPGGRVRPGPVVFPRVEPDNEKLKPVLGELLSLQPDAASQTALLKRMFPKLKDADAQKLVETLLAAAPAPASAGAGGSERQDPSAAADPATEITIDQFMAVTLKVGQIVTGERVPKSAKMLKFTVDVGETHPDGTKRLRQILSGIGKAYEPDELVGKKVAVVANLKPAKLMGQLSEGMILASGEGDERANLTVCTLPDAAKPGDRIR